MTKISKDLTRVMVRLKALYRVGPERGQQVYGRHRCRMAAEINEAGVRAGELYYHSSICTAALARSGEIIGREQEAQQTQLLRQIHR